MACWGANYLGGLGSIWGIRSYVSVVAGWFGGAHSGGALNRLVFED